MPKGGKFHIIYKDSSKPEKYPTKATDFFYGIMFFKRQVYMLPICQQLLYFVRFTVFFNTPAIVEFANTL